jgi:hypothetical protein
MSPTSTLLLSLSILILITFFLSQSYTQIQHQDDLISQLKQLYYSQRVQLNNNNKDNNIDGSTNQVIMATEKKKKKNGERKELQVIRIFDLAQKPEESHREQKQSERVDLNVDLKDESHRARLGSDNNGRIGLNEEENDPTNIRRNESQDSLVDQKGYSNEMNSKNDYSSRQNRENNKEYTGKDDSNGQQIEDEYPIGKIFQNEEYSFTAKQMNKFIVGGKSRGGFYDGTSLILNTQIVSLPAKPSYIQYEEKLNQPLFNEWSR